MKELTYKVVANGYEIYLNGTLWITQYDPWSKLYVANGTYEENAIAHMEELNLSLNPPTATE